MSEKKKVVMEPRSGNSKRHGSRERNRRRTLSEKCESRNRPKLELLPSIVLSNANYRVSIPNLTQVGKGQPLKTSAESHKPSTKPLCLNDCKHFLQGNCKKGSDCNYRHQESARNATIVCKFWLKNECTNLNCSYLHSKSLPSRQEKVPCHFEQREGGCQKADCNFFHKLPQRKKSSVTNVTKAMKNLSLPQKSEPDYAKCGFCGSDLSGDIALKTGSLIYCIRCADMI